MAGSTPEIDTHTIDDILNGQEHIRVADHRTLIQAPTPLQTHARSCVNRHALFQAFAPVLVAGFAAACYSLVGLYLALFGTAMAATAVVALYDAVERASVKDYYLFDYDRFKLYPVHTCTYNAIRITICLTMIASNSTRFTRAHITLILLW